MRDCRHTPLYSSEVKREKLNYCKSSGGGCTCLRAPWLATPVAVRASVVCLHLATAGSKHGHLTAEYLTNVEKAKRIIITAAAASKGLMGTRTCALCLEPITQRPPLQPVSAASWTTTSQTTPPAPRARSTRPVFAPAVV